MRIGHARPSSALARQSPLVHGRFSFQDEDPGSGLERVDDGEGEGEGAAAGAGMDGWFLVLSERGEQLVDVLVEGAVELAVDVVEVAGLPDAADLAPGLGEGVALDGVLDQDSAAGAVQLELVGRRIGIGGVVGADQAADRSAGEVEGGHQGRIAPAGLVGHLGGHRVDRPAQVLEHVEAVALGLDEVGVGMGARPPLAAETPGGEKQPPERASASRSRMSASSRSKTNGFSTNSGNPARMTSSVGSKWPSLGRHSETRSGRSRSSISSMSTYGLAPNSWARAVVRSGVRPTTANRSTSGRS